MCASAQLIGVLALLAAVVAFALGCDMINVAREAMLAIGCIQAQKVLRRDLVRVAEACGVHHPGLIGTDSVDILDGRTTATPLNAE